MATDRDDRDPQLELPLPSILEAFEWIGADLLDQIDDRNERERFLVVLQLGWNFELALRWDQQAAMDALRDLLKDSPTPEEVGRSVLTAVVLKRERYVGDPRRITAVRLVDGANGEELAIEWELAHNPFSIGWN